MSIASEISRIQTNIANAYTSCSNKGATMPVTQNSANLSSTIDTIQTGVTPTVVEWKDVNFIDYDGTLLYSYTLAEAQQLTALPTLPSHTGLTCQGWNWTLANIKSSNKPVIVGAVYNTTDGSTKIHIKISSSTDTEMNLFLRSYSGTFTLSINWGDGTTESFSINTTQKLYTHNYSAVGNYSIVLTVPSGKYLISGGNSISKSLFGNTSEVAYRTISKVVGINLGSNFKYIGGYMIYMCRSCEYITIANGIVFNSTYGLAQCGFKCVVLPTSVTDTKNYAFRYCYMLETVSLPKELTTLGNYAFDGCCSLKNVTIGWFTRNTWYLLF